jgi:hypothetical protein
MAVRIVDGVAYEIKRDGAFKVVAHDLGNGHLEVTASREQIGRELDWSASVIADHLAMLEKYREDHADEIRQKAVRIAANRAKKRVRQLCKANGVDTLLTLTYRAKETDLARVKADLKEFNRRVLRELPAFGFVAAFELQERGAWHVHAATARIPSHFMKTSRDPRTGEVKGKARVKSYDLLRSIWRSVVGDRGGNVDVSRTKVRERSAARIAAYIAKYVTKAYAEGEKWSNRWTKYGFSDTPKPVQLGKVWSSREVWDVIYSLPSLGQQVVQAVWSSFGEWAFFAVERGDSRSFAAA